VRFPVLPGFRGRHKGGEHAGAVRAARATLALCNALLSERGEISGLRLAGECLAAWRTLDGEARAAFLDLLATELSPDPDKAVAAAESYRADTSPVNLAWLIKSVEPQRQELFRRLNAVAGGTRDLAGMRAYLLPQLDAHPQWAAIEADLEHLLTSWFNRGFLSLVRIDWRSPAIVLEKLIQYEAVHQIQGWGDLRRRLEADRRCYAFCHQALGDEPIIFVEVALTHGMSASVQPLLDTSSPVLDVRSANCAMFYSITNCQEGLRGIPFGDFLIKQVVDDLSRELPQIKIFATLSPIPSFRAWLETAAHSAADVFIEKPADLLSSLDNTNWTSDDRESALLKQKLEPLCAWYLLNVKNGHEPLDPVARFHLRNGARLQRLNWLGDKSPAGLQRSLGEMVNYVYRLRDVEGNHESYMREYKISASSQIHSLARRATVNGATKTQLAR
jgi:malonyl-CoA decarboxylase